MISVIMFYYGHWTIDYYLPMFILKRMKIIIIFTYVLY